MNSRKLTLKNLVAYGLGDLYGGGSFLIIGMLFMYFLTEVVGLEPFTAGIIFAVGKIWDAVSDPLMGHISDNTRSRHGRRRLFLLIGVIPVFISFVLLWLNFPAWPPLLQAVYYTLCYLLFSTVFTMVMVPYCALNAELSHDYNERTRLSGARMIFSQIASLLAGTLPGVLLNIYSHDKGQGFLIMALFFGLLFSLPLLLVYKGTWELDIPEEKQEKSMKEIFRDFFSILKNRTFRIHIAMYICAYTAMDVLMAFFIYYLNFYIKMPGAYSIAMGSLLGAQLLSLPFYIGLSNRKGKGFAYRWGLTFWAAGLLAATLVSMNPVLTLLIPACIILGHGQIAGVFISWAILPSVIDIGELISGEQRSGTYSGALTLIRKIVQGLIAMPLLGLILQYIGFGKGSDIPENIHLFPWFFTGTPVFFIISGILISLKFPVTPYTHGILKSILQKYREQNNLSEISEEEKKQCQNLTGQDWKNLAPYQ